jgi:glutamate transport system permease protein
MLLSGLATWLEKRSRRSRKTSARPVAPPGAIPAIGGGSANVHDGVTLK